MFVPFRFLLFYNRAYFYRKNLIIFLIFINLYRLHPNKPITIVIDTLNLSHNEIFSKKIQLLGGRFTHAYNVIKSFFRQLKIYEVTLVFFIDGCIVDEKSQTKFNRIMSSYRKTIDLMDEIASGKTITDIMMDEKKNSSKLTPLDTSVVMMVLAKIYGQTYISYDVECDIALAKYATRNDVFAVLSSDSDFFIFPGNWRIWSVKNLCMNTLTTTEVDKCLLRAAMGLKEHQMPLLATLMGNDFLPHDKLRNYHLKCSSIIKNENETSNYKEKQNNIIRDIKTMPEYLKDWTTDDYNHLSMRLFDEISDENITLIKQSMTQYELSDVPDDAQQNDVDDDPIARMFENEYFSYNYRLLKKIRIDFSFSQIDLRTHMKFTNVPQMHIDLLRKQMGILFFNKRSEINQSDNGQVIYIMDTHESDYEMKIVYPIYPTDKCKFK